MGKVVFFFEHNRVACVHSTVSDLCMEMVSGGHLISLFADSYFFDLFVIILIWDTLWYLTFYLTSI